MGARSDHQLNLPPVALTNGSPRPPARTNRSSDPGVIAAWIVDQAVAGSGLTNTEVAQRCEVSESLVRRWRSPNYREIPSATQLAMLPDAFQFAYNRAHSKAYGCAAAALNQIAESLGAVALAAEEPRAPQILAQEKAERRSA